MRGKNDANEACKKAVLNSSESVVLKLVAAGKTSWEIARVLNISQHTVDWYIFSSVRKLSAANRAEAIAKFVLRSSAGDGPGSKDGILDVLAAQPIGEGEQPLTPREFETLKWTAVGKTSWEIAQILNISQHTVDWYIASAAKKMKAINRAQAVAVFIEKQIKYKADKRKIANLDQPPDTFLLDLLLPASSASTQIDALENLFRSRWLVRYGRRKAKWVFYVQSVATIFHTYRSMIVKAALVLVGAMGWSGLTALIGKS